MIEYLLGVAYSPQELNIAVLKKSGKNYRLLDLSRVTPKNFTNWVKEQIPTNAEVYAVVTVPESLIFLQELEVPKLPDNELSEAIYWEVSTKTTSFPKESTLQWKKIGGDGRTQRVVTMVMKEQEVGDIMSLVGDSGVQVLAIEPVTSAFTRVTDTPMSAPVLLVHLEATETNLVVLAHGVPVFSLAVPMTLTEQKTQKTKLVEETRAALAAGIKRVLSYWSDQNQKPISDVVLTGMGVRYTGLIHAIHASVRLPVRVAKLKPIKGLMGDQYFQTGPYLLAVGAAARSIIHAEEPEINFAPKKEKEHMTKLLKTKTLATNIRSFTKLNAALTLIILILSGLLYIQIAAFNRDITQAKRFVQNHPAQKFTGEMSAANATITSVDSLLREQKNLGNQLSKLSAWTPTGVTLTAIKFKAIPNQEWEIQGVADRTDILAFYTKLKNQSGATVTMPYSSLEKEKQGAFKIILVWQ